jgi:hypothetical protein
MKQVFLRILSGVDSKLPQYFLVKGGRLQVVPTSVDEYNNLLESGYEPLVEVDYEALDREILEALNELIGKLGNRAVLLYPLAVATIISHEASRSEAKLYKALHKEKTAPKKESDSRGAVSSKRTKRSEA